MQFYSNFAYGPAIATEFAMLQHLEELDTQGSVYDATDQLSPSLLQKARERFPARLCRYLRSVRVRLSRS